MAIAALSGSTDGKGIKVVATASSGTTIHTGSSTATDYDEPTLSACNTDTVPRLLTVQWGSTAAPDDSIIMTLPAQSGLVPITPEGVRLVLKGNASPLVIRAFCDTANVVVIHGSVKTFR